MMCDEARAALLAGEDTDRFEGHFSGCADCRLARSRLERMRGALSDPAVWDEPTPSREEMLAGVLARRPDAPARLPVPRRLIAAVAAIGVVAATAVVVTLLVHDPADWSVPLTGAEAAPAATGVVAGWNADGESRLVLETSGLEPAPPGAVYELWFMSDGGAVSAGTFVDPDRVDLMVGIPWRDYPNVLVTLQDPDAYPSPSATWVLWNAWKEEEG
jgi:hypothetical protein